MFKNNKIYIIDKNGKKKQVFFIKGLKIKFKGKNSTITIEKPSLRFRRCSITCGNNCKIFISSSKYTAKKMYIAAIGENSICEIGKDLFCCVTRKSLTAALRIRKRKPAKDTQHQKIGTADDLTKKGIAIIPIRMLRTAADRNIKFLL